jgi:hypothetical protein
MVLRILVGILFLPALAAGQTVPPEVHKITLHPSAVPSPVLRYRLFPEIRDLKAGNAALLYQRAHSPEWYGPLHKNTSFDKIDWHDTGLDKFPVAEADKVLAFRGMIEEIDRASRRTYCDWELNDRLRIDGIGLLLPDLQSFREYARLVDIRARRALVDRKFDEAAYSIQTGLSLARHCGEGPTLIHHLVGIAIANVQTTPIEDWIGLPDSPNLYWSLTTLPRPLIPLRNSLGGERLFIDSLFPGARELLHNPKAPPLALDKIDAAFRLLKGEAKESPLESLGFAAALAMGFQDAKKYLLAHDWTEARIEKLGTQQAVLLYMVAEYDRMFEQIEAAVTLPYVEAQPMLQRIEDEVKKSRKTWNTGMTLAALVLPAMQKVTMAHVRTDRRFASLRVIEALRLHAKEKGTLPDKLEDVTIVPIPLDAGTGKAFDYRRDGDTATLTLAPLRGGDVQTLRYELRLAASK